MTAALTPAVEAGWYDDEDRFGYNQGHICCPDCGDCPNDHTLHADGCPRIGTPLQDEATWGSR